MLLEVFGSESVIVERLKSEEAEEKFVRRLKL